MKIKKRVPKNSAKEAIRSSSILKSKTSWNRGLGVDFSVSAFMPLVGSVDSLKSRVSAELLEIKTDVASVLDILFLKKRERKKMNENLTGPTVSNDWHGKTHLFGQIFT
jgi:hypothetical protein